ncbi:hypothetical protein CC1G_03022 [Coprinopsis cinerea okayama7|uniref:DUF3752 domain-containing protein n=1 Tax=Coprinopsis cinerea (strain Okayama-7 / 130 / ATCC MYA-4618 / FGSC 9003) TaxID=240176 RepID=A8NS44_COPC7|nr:hypothetical protein CC1G_03022 [Coprinopsis cinerea okayama7\|eukprot:XP_001835934.2 hypothetical protein CC1G_03022 [Coprinopsis cinerea okayama7\
MANIGPQLPPHLQNQFESRKDEEESDDDVGSSLPPSIGPQIPLSLVQKKDDNDEREKEQEGAAVGIGPAIPAHLLSRKKEDDAEEDSGDDIGPSIGPVAGPSRPSPSPGPSNPGKRVIGPSFPTYAPTYDPKTYSQVQNPDDDSDDDVGPKPLPAGMKHQESSAVQEFIEREERRRKQLEEASKPKAPKREEWMLVPPSHSDLLGNLDPSRLKKGRQFSKSTAEPRATDTSLWTETPAERQKRLADEVSGKKRRAVDSAPADDDPDKKRRKQEEERIRKGVEEYTKKQRGGALVDQHAAATASKEGSEEPPVIWDHARDMAIGGRLMDDGKRKQMLQEAKGLGSRFSSGKGGGFL